MKLWLLTKFKSIGLILFSIIFQGFWKGVVRNEWTIREEESSSLSSFIVKIVIVFPCIRNLRDRE